MGLDESDVVDDSGGKSLGSSTVSCSICLEPVTDNGDRSWAKLQCGHEFHLDCIGSAFNIKGAMQCPNCRKIEKGQWLFAAGCRSFPDLSFEDWPHDEDIYDLSYSEMSFGVQWCPFTAFPRLPEEGEFQSTTYHDLLGQHAVFAEQSSSTHPCPYVTYYGPIHSSSSNSLETTASDWGSPSEVAASYAYASMDPGYHSWDHPVSDPRDQPSLPSMTHRSSRTHPFVASPRVGSSVTSSMIPPYPGSAARARDRAQALQAYFQPPSGSLPMRTPAMSATSRRSNNHHRGMSQAGPMSDQMNGFYMFPPPQNFPEPENQIPSSRYHPWDRDHYFDSGFHHPAGGPSRQRHHGSERTPSQNRS